MKAILIFYVLIHTSASVAVYSGIPLSNSRKVTVSFVVSAFVHAV